MTEPGDAPHRRSVVDRLETAGLVVPDADVDAIAAAWVDLRARTDRLWFAATRDVEPAVRFDACPESPI